MSSNVDHHKAASRFLDDLLKPDWRQWEREQAAIGVRRHLAALRAENEQLKETVGEWQEIHGVNPTSNVHGACQVEIERLREDNRIIMAAEKATQAENQRLRAEFEGVNAINAQLVDQLNQRLTETEAEIERLQTANRMLVKEIGRHD